MKKELKNIHSPWKQNPKFNKNMLSNKAVAPGKTNNMFNQDSRVEFKRALTGHVVFHL